MTVNCSPKETKQEQYVGDFSWALYSLKAGHKMYRGTWENWQYVEMQRPETESKMNLTYIYWTPQPGLFIPWTPSQSDLICDDWELVIPKGEEKKDGI